MNEVAGFGGLGCAMDSVGTRGVEIERQVGLVAPAEFAACARERVVTVGQSFPRRSLIGVDK